MTRITTEQNNFASGEIDPRLIGQTDIKAYKQGVKLARNVARLATGGYERRPGSYDLGGITALARLEAFEFSDTQRYMVAFSDARVTVFDLNGVVITTLTGMPWNAAQAFEMTTSQLGDTMIISHTAFLMRRLVRTGTNTFTVLLFAFTPSLEGRKIYQPYYKFVDDSITVTPAGTAGGTAMTLTVKDSAGAAYAFFTSDYIGTRLRIYDVEVVVNAIYSSSSAQVTPLEDIKVKLDLDPYKTKAGSTVVEVLHLNHGLKDGETATLSGSNVTGGIAAASLDGARVVSVIDDHHYKITAGAAATTSEDGGGSNVEVNPVGMRLRQWYEPSISAVRGYPGACAFHEGRLWLGGTPSQPDARWGSNALLFYKFDVGSGYDGDSVQGAVGSEDISRIKHIVSNGELQLFTATRELVEATRDGESITPANQRTKQQSAAGSSNMQPIVFDGATLFAQENGRSICEFTYSSEQGGYLAIPVSTLASHLINSPVSAAASQGVTSRSEQYAFFANADGTLAVFHSLRNENIAGWGLWTLGAGAVRSIASVGEYVFMCVEIRGVFRLYRLASDDIVSLDGAVLHTSAVTKTTWTLDPRVAGRVVNLVSELGSHGAIDVPDDGLITLDVPVANLVAGDAYYMTVETLPPVVDLPNGTRTRLIKRIIRTILELFNAHAVTVDGQRLVTLDAGEPWEGAITPITGQREVRHLGFKRSPTTIFSQTEPLPATVLAYTQEVNV